VLEGELGCVVVAVEEPEAVPDGDGLAVERGVADDQDADRGVDVRVADLGRQQAGVDRHGPGGHRQRGEVAGDPGSRGLGQDGDPVAGPQGSRTGQQTGRDAVDTGPQLRPGHVGPGSALAVAQRQVRRRGVGPVVHQCGEGLERHAEKVPTDSR
jgi:hypothetical protein